MVDDKSPSHLCCLGFDPRLEDIPTAVKTSGSIKRIITDFFSLILDASPEIHMFKLNFAYFEQYGLEGMEALQECITLSKAANKYVIADVKRGDIDITNKAIIEGLSKTWKVDAATFHTVLGRDTFSHLNSSGLRPYFLIRTSNPSAADLQGVELKGSKLPFFVYVLDYYLGQFPEGGFVVGGTDLKALTQCMELCQKRKAHPYLLIPGVGRQEADAERLMTLLTQHYRDQLSTRVVINVSSAIIYAAPAATTSPKSVSLAIREAVRSYTDLLRPR